MNAAKDCTLQEKLLRCAMALILAAGALLASVAASPAYAAPSTVDVSIGGKIPYGGFATTWMSADGNIAYCAEPSSPTPAPGSYSTSPVPSGDVTAAIWYSFGSPGFDASMFPGSWYDGGGWDDAKYAAASHVLIAYAYSGSESAATHGTSAEFASWAKSELIGGTFAKMKAGAGKVSAGFEAFCVRTGGGSQTLVSFSWSAGGVKVAKHGNRAASSLCGTADCLEALGINIQQDPQLALKMLEETNFCFLFAQKYHAAMKYVGPIRKELGFRTVFNILGPLTNPAKPEMFLLGVYDGYLVEPLAKVLASLGVKRGLVAYGQEKLDEISPNGPTTICELRDGYYRTSVIKPEDFGLTPGTKEDLVGGTPEVNAQITRDVLSGKIQGTKRNAVLMNSGAAFFVAGKADSIADGIQLAANLIDSGKATAALEKCIAVSNE